MKCRQAEQWMDAALDAAMARKAGEPGAAEVLPEGWRAELDAHLQGCARCRRLWTQLGAAHAALRVPRPVPAPEGMLADFHRRAAEAQRPAVLRPRPQPWLWVWPLASAAAGAAAAWMIAARVAPMSIPTPFEHVAKSSIRPPAAAPDTPPAAVEDRTAEPARPLAAAPGPSAGRARKKPFAPNAERAGSTALDRPSFGRGRGYADFDAKPGTEDLYASGASRPATSSLAARAQDRDRAAEESLALRVQTPAMAKRVSEPARQPAALGVEPGGSFYYRGDVNAVQSSEQDPPELRVSPAVLTALQRTVEPGSTTTSVQQAAQVLAQAADIALEVDPRVAHRTVTLSENGVPLWKALEVVAEQSQAQVLPVRDHLVLKPLPAAARAPRIAGNVRLENAPAGPAGPSAAAAPAPAGAQKPAGAPGAPAAPASLPEVQARTAPTEPQAVKRAPASVAAKSATANALGQRAASARGVDKRAKQDSAAVERYSVLAAGAAPDRKVWGEAWGTLPERGFAVPSPEEIPPQTLGLDAAKNAEPTLRQVAPGQQAAPGQQQQLNNNVLRRNRQQNSR